MNTALPVACCDLHRQHPRMKSTQAMVAFQYKASEVADPPQRAPVEGPSVISESAPGFLLMAADCKPMYANAAAMRILLHRQSEDVATVLERWKGRGWCVVALVAKSARDGVV
jgi:hypothetical protein